jgi:hypothetical protein
VDPEHVNGDIYDPQSWNSYAYARNNPLRVTDPDGREYEICTHAIVGISCTPISDPQFEKVARNPGVGIELRDGRIYAGGQEVGYYRQTFIDPTIASVFGNAGLMADTGFKLGLAITSPSMAFATGLTISSAIAAGTELVALGGKAGFDLLSTYLASTHSILQPMPVDNSIAVFPDVPDECG